jgi:hypothetical protein
VFWCGACFGAGDRLSAAPAAAVARSLITPEGPRSISAQPGIEIPATSTAKDENTIDKSFI